MPGMALRACHFSSFLNSLLFFTTFDTRVSGISRSQVGGTRRGIFSAFSDFHMGLHHSQHMSDTSGEVMSAAVVLT